MAFPVLRVPLACLALVLTACPAAHSGMQTVELLSEMDNTLYENTLGEISNALGQHMFAGRVSSGGLRRALVRFDIAAAIPHGSTIHSAELTLSMSRSLDGGSTVSLHRCLAAWGQGTSTATDQEGLGDFSTIGDPTWIHTFFDAGFWSSAGGDFQPVASASRVVGGPDVYTWSSTAALVADVQGWLDSPGENFGWLIKGEESYTRTAKRFDTRENSNPMLRPQLVIEYAAPTSCPGDADGNGRVEFADIALMLSAFGNPFTFQSIGEALANFGSACGA